MSIEVEKGRVKSRPIAVWGKGGSKIVCWARVSPEDYDTIKMAKWFLSDGYCYRTAYIDGHKTTVPMHRQIMGLPNGDPLEVDHRDRDRMNNTRENLRILERWQNEVNKPKDPNDSSSQVGVTFDKARGKWKAQASLDGVYQYLGIHDTEEEAIAARLAWEHEVGRVRSTVEVD